jgi:hypothetical protein
MMRAQIVVLALAAAGAGSGCRAAEEEAAAAPAGAAGPVLVELFTSQGCSSCPPADQLLGQLPRAVDGVEVLPLAFHVDYWDDLGWRDPFSSAAWTERQRLYAGAVSDGRIYTPQLVVQGVDDVVGSDRSGALARIRRAGRSGTTGRIRASVSGDGPLTVAVEAELADRRAARADAWVALSESGLATRVARGENQGRSLVNDFVVRRLVKAFSIAPGAAQRGQVALAVDAGWRRDRLSVTVFLQDPDSRRVLAAAAGQRTSSSSTSKRSVAPGGMTPPAPRAP